MKRRGKRGVPVGILNKVGKASLALAQKPKGVKGMGRGTSGGRTIQVKELAYAKALR